MSFHSQDVSHFQLFDLHYVQHSLRLMEECCLYEVMDYRSASLFDPTRPHLRQPRQTSAQMKL